MNIGYRNRFYQQRRTWPQLDSPKACPPPPRQQHRERANQTNKARCLRHLQHLVRQTVAVLRQISTASRQCLEKALISARDIAGAMGVSKGTVSKMAKRAMQEGWLKKQGRNYALVVDSLQFLFSAPIGRKGKTKN